VAGFPSLEVAERLIFLSENNYSHLVEDMYETGPKWLLLNRIEGIRKGLFLKWSQYVVQISPRVEKLIYGINKEPKETRLLMMFFALSIADLG
jgi:hypothetical protein